MFRLLQARLEKEEFEEELTELKEKVGTMKRQIPDPDHTQTLNQVNITHCAEFHKNLAVDKEKPVFFVISLCISDIASVSQISQIFIKVTNRHFNPLIPD